MAYLKRQANITIEEFYAAFSEGYRPEDFEQLFIKEDLNM